MWVRKKGNELVGRRALPARKQSKGWSTESVCLLQMLRPDNINERSKLWPLFWDSHKNAGVSLYNVGVPCFSSKGSMNPKLLESSKRMSLMLILIPAGSNKWFTKWKKSLTNWLLSITLSSRDLSTKIKALTSRIFCRTLGFLSSRLLCCFSNSSSTHFLNLDCHWSYDIRFSHHIFSKIRFLLKTFPTGSILAFHWPLASSYPPSSSSSHNTSNSSSTTYLSKGALMFPGFNGSSCKVTTARTPNINKKCVGVILSNVCCAEKCLQWKNVCYLM